MCPVDEAKKRDIGLSDLLWSWTAYELGHQDKKEEVGGGHKGGGNERGTSESVIFRTWDKQKRVFGFEECRGTTSLTKKHSGGVRGALRRSLLPIPVYILFISFFERVFVNSPPWKVSSWAGWPRKSKLSP